jgi:hypothetical protein
MEDELDFLVNRKKTTIYEKFMFFKVPILRGRKILNGGLSELAG